MDRIKINSISQRKFLDLMVEKLNSPSLRGLLQFGFDVKYSSLKNYYSGIRLIPKDLFDDLIELSGVSVDFEIVGGSWGQIKGGKLGKKKV
ncbi:MAG: hypothetical protein NUV97_03550 [archaeon]|nr:hypothetical protein [archaeon]MCR4323907.1 hypothetical protein [Nanoarchaeota archaeon]